MSKTFNRNPFTVPTPSKNDIQDYFFTHSNFKGLSNDKNFLTADPETFSDCNNVYVDSEGLLRSRPALKKQVVTAHSTGQTLSNVANIWTFNNVSVYLTDNGYLIFINNFTKKSLQISSTKDCKLVLAENKIFIFEASRLRYYDVDTNTVSTSDHCINNYVYVPITKLYTNGVPTELEKENELTTSYIIRYLFDNAGKDTFSILVGKTITIELNDISYTFTFVENNEKVFVQKLSEIPTNYLHISVSDIGSFIVVTNYADNTYSIRYSLDGKVFDTILTNNDAKSYPTISSDGMYICYPGEKDIYVCKVLSTDGTDITSYTWSPLLQNIDKEKYNSYLNSGMLQLSVVSIVKMLSYDIFSFVTISSDKSARCIVCYKGEFTYHRIRALNYDLPAPTVGDYSTDMETVSVDGVSSFGLYSLPDVNFYYTLTGNDLYNYVRETFKLRLNHESTGDTLVGTIAYQLYSSSGTSGGKIAEVNVKIPIPKNYTNYRIGQNKVYVQKTGDWYTFKFYRGERFMYDAYYTGRTKGTDGFTSFASFVNTYKNPINIDMFADNNTYSVVINAGEVCIIAPDMASSTSMDWKDVGFIGKCMLTDTINPLYYGLSTSLTGFNVALPTSETGDDTTVYVGNYNTSNYVANSYSVGNTRTVISADGDVLTDTYLYTKSSKISLLFPAIPIKILLDGIFVYKTGSLYSSVKGDVIQIDETINGTVNYVLPDFVSEIDNFYFAQGKTLYISSYPSDGQFKWYFPKINTEVFDDEISNIHPISSTEMAIFLNDSVYYITRSDAGYLYYKSKIQTGCKKHADIITSFDGKYIMFVSSRGLVALSYQDFVATTEQTLTFLSDGIHDTFKAFNSGEPVKLYKYDFWIICYKEDVSKYLLFDIRNNSWWPMNVKYPITKFVTINDEPRLLSTYGNLYTFCYGNTYYDEYVYNKIDWYFASQQLHLSAPNYYKHISNITLTSVLDTDKEIYLDLILYNYRKKMHKSDIEAFSFTVDSIRTYVKRLNYAKVNEFKYELTSNQDLAADESEASLTDRVPLSLSSITIKYKITGQVR